MAADAIRGKGPFLPDSLLERARSRGTYGPVLLPVERAAQRAVNDEHVSTYLTWQAEQKGAGTDTVVSYAGVLARFLDLCVRGRPLDAVTQGDIEEWLVRPRAGRARGGIASAATRSRDLTIIRTFYGWMLARGMVTRNIPELCVSPKVANRNPRPIRDELWAWLFPQLESEARVALGLMYYLGIRRAEIVALEGRHFDPSQGLLTGFTRKGGGDDALPYLEVLEVYNDGLPHLLCGRTPTSIAAEWEHHARAVGFHSRLFPFHPDGINKRFAHGWVPRDAPPFTPHQLRHSAATNLLRCGLPLDMVSWLMNHGSVEVTMRYVKQSQSRLKEWRNR